MFESDESISNICKKMCLERFESETNSSDDVFGRKSDDILITNIGIIKWIYVIEDEKILQ